MSDERIEAAGKVWNLIRRSANCRLYEFEDEFENILHVHVIRNSPFHGVAMDPRGNLIHASTTGCKTLLDALLHFAAVWDEL